MKNGFAYLKDNPPPAQTHPETGPAARISQGQGGAAGELLPQTEKQPTKSDRKQPSCQNQIPPVKQPPL